MASESTNAATTNGISQNGMNHNGGTDSDELHVLIIGAGVTGLLVAHGLKQAGIRATVFEAEPESHYRPREWSMGIHWSLPMLEKLLPPELVRTMNEAQNDPSWVPPETDVMRIYNGLDGSIMKEMPIPRTVRVSRRKMRAHCSRGIDVKYNHSLSDIEYNDFPKGGVTASFTNGSFYKGSLVVGCDGPRSKVRELLLGKQRADITPMEIIHSNVAIVYGDAEKARFVRSAHPVFSMMVHPEMLVFIAMQDVPSPDDPANWKFQVVTSRLATPSDTFESASDEERLRDLKSRAANLAEPFRSAVQWIPNGTKVSTNNIAFWHPVPFSGETSGEASGREASSVGAGGGGRGGRATLAGDAAHPMPPHRGQGLNHAICDAFNLVGALEEVRDGVKEMEEAIRSYSDEVVKRGAEEVQISCMNARMFLDWEMLRESPIMKRGLDRHSGEGGGEVNGDGARA